MGGINLPSTMTFIKLMGKVKPLMEALNEQMDGYKIITPPEIVKTETEDGKTVFVITERVAFTSEKDAKKYMKISKAVSNL